MKKIFTFAAAVLASLSMMATSTTITWVPTEADVTSLVSGSTHSVTVGSGASIFELRAARPWSGDNSTVKLEWANPGVKMTDNGMLKASIAVFVPSTSNDIENIVFYLHTSNNRKTYYYEGTSLEDATGTATTDAVAKTSTAYTYWTTFAKETYYVVGGKTGGSGDTYYDSIKVTFTEGTGVTQYTVTYMNGETVLGTERVSAGETAVKHGDFETVASTEFQGWFNDAAFTSTADFSAAITADKTFYGKFIHVASSENLLKELWLSNGVKAYIVRVDSTNIATVKGCYMAGQAAPTVQSNSVSEGATFAQNGNTITVTAENGDAKDYALTLTEVTPLSTFTSGNTITFDGTEVEADGYIYSVYGWDENKGIKWGKPLDEAKNMRIREGKNRVYMFLPACDSVAFIGGSGGARDVEIRVNGVVNEVKKTPAKDAQILVKGFNAEAANMVSFESNGSTNGDSGFTGMIIYNGSTPTAVENVEAAKAIKVIENGQIVIIKNGVRYNAVGAKL